MSLNFLLVMIIVLLFAAVLYLVFTSPQFRAMDQRRKRVVMAVGCGVPALVVLFLVVGNCLVHDWQSATCTGPET